MHTKMTAEAAFRSDEHFTQDEFRRWLDDRPQSDINHYELINGRIVMIPPAGWPHGRVGMALSSRLNEHVSSHGKIKSRVLPKLDLSVEDVFAF